MQSTPLSDQLRAMRTAAQAADAHGWLNSALHALVMAVLGRIFGRLGQLIMLWQSGCLALPQPPRTAHDTAIRASNRGRFDQRGAPDLRMSRHLARRPASPAHATASTPAWSLPRTRAVMRVPRPATGVTPSATVASRARPHPARAPPAVQMSASPPRAGARNCAVFVTLSQ